MDATVDSRLQATTGALRLRTPLGVASLVHPGSQRLVCGIIETEVGLVEAVDAAERLGEALRAEAAVLLLGESEEAGSSPDAGTNRRRRGSPGAQLTRTRRGPCRRPTPPGRSLARNRWPPPAACGRPTPGRRGCRCPVADRQPHEGLGLPDDGHGEAGLAESDLEGLAKQGDVDGRGGEEVEVVGGPLGEAVDHRAPPPARAKPRASGRAATIRATRS